MRITTSHCILPLFLIITLLVFTNSYGQKKVEYEGSHKMSEVNGFAQYTYVPNGSDTLLDGSFYFSNSQNTGENISEGLTSFEVNGNYKKNVPDGEWNFKQITLKPGENTKLVDYKYVTTLNGQEDQIAGHFIDGLPQGSWTLSRFGINDSRITDTLFQSSITYNKGVPQLSAKLYSETSSLVTRFLRNGLAHDEWTLFGNSAIEPVEVWTFENGRLRTIEFSGEEEYFKLYEGEDSEQTYREINLNQNFLSILAITFPELEKITAFKEGIYQLLSTQENLLSKVERLFTEEKLTLAAYKVKVPHFPLSDKESETLDRISSLAEESIRIANGILSNSQLNIAKLSDEKTAENYNATDSIKSNYLEPLSVLLRMQNQEIMQYIDRSDVIQYMFPNGLKAQENEAKEQTGKNLSIPSLQSQSTEEISLSEIENLCQEVYSSLNFLRQKLSSKASIQIREKAIVSEEALLVRKAQNFQALLTSIEKAANKEVANTLESISLFSETKLTNYAKMEDSQNKLNVAIALEDCYEDLSSLVTTLGGLEEQKEEIMQLYTDEVWNPFTSTIMSENVKRRITKAYEDILIPHTLEKIEKQLTCDNSDDFSKEFQVIADRMIVLRDMKTNKIERKLRRKSDPDVTLSLLGLNPE